MNLNSRINTIDKEMYILCSTVKKLSEDVEELKNNTILNDYYIFSNLPKKISGGKK